MQRGFTLLETIIVVAILAAVAAAVVPMLGEVQDDALLKVTRHEVASLRDACVAFRRDVGYYPKTIGDLTSIAPPSEVCAPDLSAAPDGDPPVVAFPAGRSAWDPEAKRGFRGPYLTAPRPLVTPGKLPDAWDRASANPRRLWSYSVESHALVVRSQGADVGLASDDVKETLP